jgi:hypothetical protein
VSGGLRIAPQRGADAACATAFGASDRRGELAGRYRGEGQAGMADRSSRQHHSPNQTSEPVVGQIVVLRWRHRLGPVQIASRLGIAASTVHAVLMRCRINRLSRIDRVTGEPLAPLRTSSSPTATATGSSDAYKATATNAPPPARPEARTANHDRQSLPAHHQRRSLPRRLGITPKRTRPYRPQTNDKNERFHHTPANGWAYARHYNTDHDRRTALPDRLHFYITTEPTPPSQANHPPPA